MILPFVTAALLFHAHSGAAQTVTVTAAPPATTNFVSELIAGAKSILDSIYPQISSFATITLPTTVVIEGSTYRIPDIIFPTGPANPTTSSTNSFSNTDSSTASVIAAPTVPFATPTMSSAQVSPSSTLLSPSSTSLSASHSLSSLSTAPTKVSAAVSQLSSQASPTSLSSGSSSTNDPTADSSSHHGGASNHLGLILGLILGLLALLVLLLLLFLFLRRRRRQRDRWLGEENEKNSVDGETAALRNGSPRPAWWSDGAVGAAGAAGVAGGSLAAERRNHTNRDERNDSLAPISTREDGYQPHRLAVIPESDYSSRNNSMRHPVDPYASTSEEAALMTAADGPYSAANRASRRRGSSGASFGLEPPIAPVPDPYISRGSPPARPQAQRTNSIPRKPVPTALAPLNTQQHHLLSSDNPFTSPDDEFGPTTPPTPPVRSPQRWSGSSGGSIYRPSPEARGFDYVSGGDRRWSGNGPQGWQRNRGYGPVTSWSPPSNW